MTKKVTKNLSELPPSPAQRAFVDSIMDGVKESRRPKLKISSLGPFRVASVETKKISDHFGEFIKLNEPPALPSVLELFRKLGASERATKRKMKQLLEAIWDDGHGLDSWEKNGGGELSISVYEVLKDTYLRAQILLAPLVEVELEEAKNGKKGQGKLNLSPDDWATVAETMRTIGHLESWAYFALFEKDLAGVQEKDKAQRKQRRDTKTTKQDIIDRNKQIRCDFLEKKRLKPKQSNEAIRRALSRELGLSTGTIRKAIEGTSKRKHPRLR
jgi:hypothetical protein